jgi:hypothetical protein
VANAYRIRLGDDVSYLAAEVVGPPNIKPRWRSAKVTAITDQNNLVLAIVESNGTRIPLNGGVAVPRRSAPPTGDTQTNVWRPYS